jgi:hypothetical protein
MVIKKLFMMKRFTFYDPSFADVIISLSKIYGEQWISEVKFFGACQSLCLFLYEKWTDKQVEREKHVNYVKMKRSNETYNHANSDSHFFMLKYATIVLHSSAT